MTPSSSTSSGSRITARPTIATASNSRHGRAASRSGPSTTPIATPTEASMNDEPVLGPLWNIGCKTPDVGAEIQFLERLGGRLRLHETLPGLAGPIEYAVLELGGTRILLTPSPVFESGLGYDLRPGLTHAVFEVEDHDAAIREISAAGARPLTEPRSIEAGFGRRRVAVFQAHRGAGFGGRQIPAGRGLGWGPPAGPGLPPRPPGGSVRRPLP